MRFKCFIVICLLLIGCTAVRADEAAAYPDPERFESQIKEFEKHDAKQMPPKGAVLFVGSSSIRRWHGDLANDLAPLTVIGRGFGGSNTNDLLHYSDRIVFKYQPRAILIYEGDNDVAQGVEPDHILKTYGRLLDKIEKKLPECRIYILSVKPSPRRWEMWPTMRGVNRALAELASDRNAVTYIDIASPMLDADGKPKADLYAKDQHHLNRAGYDVWRDVIRPVLAQTEREHEAN